MEVNARNISKKIDGFDLSLTLDCGQAFRWTENNGIRHGVIGGRAFDIYQNGDETVFMNVTEDEFETILRPYFDLDRDYQSMLDCLCEDETLHTAITEYPGIHILRQDTWEALCSFIISQNNNIPRIKGIITRLCEMFGEKIGENDYTFPSAQTLAGVTSEDLEPIRSGFRAKYILDAAKKVAGGETDLASLSVLPIDEARAELMKIKGVGLKVAECTLLFGCGRIEAFPVDVWVKRLLEKFYPDGLPESTKGAEGLAQQYLFHWFRNDFSENLVNN